MREFDINGQTYRAGTIDARRQWHLVRRLAPALLGVVGMAGIKDAKSLSLAAVADKIEPFLAALGKMTDEDADYIIDTCLGVVQRKVDGDRGWVNVGSGGALMYQDIDLVVMMRLVFEAGRENLGGFFDVLPSIFPKGAA